MQLYIVIYIIYTYARAHIEEREREHLWLKQRHGFGKAPSCMLDQDLGPWSVLYAEIGDSDGEWQALHSSGRRSEAIVQCLVRLCLNDL